MHACCVLIVLPSGMRPRRAKQQERRPEGANVTCQLPLATPRAAHARLPLAWPDFTTDAHIFLSSTATEAYLCVHIQPGPEAEPSPNEATCLSVCLSVRGPHGLSRSRRVYGLTTVSHVEMRELHAGVVGEHAPWPANVAGGTPSPVPPAFAAARKQQEQEPPPGSGTRGPRALAAHPCPPGAAVETESRRVRRIVTGIFEMSSLIIARIRYLLLGFDISFFFISYKEFPGATKRSTS